MFRIFFPAALIVRPARQPFRPASLWVVALTLCASAIGPSAHAQQTLSLDTALRLAEERSRQLVAQDAAAGAARSMAMAAGQLPDPCSRPASATCRSTAATGSVSRAIS